MASCLSVTSITSSAGSIMTASPCRPSATGIAPQSDSGALGGDGAASSGPELPAEAKPGGAGGLPETPERTHTSATDPGQAPVPGAGPSVASTPITEASRQVPFRGA